MIDIVSLSLVCTGLDCYPVTIIAVSEAKKLGIPIIAMTANAFEEDVQKSLSIGMNAHVAKPIDVNVLFETMKRLI